MKKLFVIAFAVCAIAVMAPQDASAATYYYGNGYSNSQVDSRIEALLREVARLQAELARIRGQAVGGQCYTYGYAEYCYSNDVDYGSSIGTGDIRSIDVDYRNSAAYVTVEYRSGREREYIVGGADSDSEVIDAMTRTLNISRSRVAALISFDDNDYDDDDDNDDNDDDIDYIRVTIDQDDDEAEARVRYEDGDTDTFSYDTDVKSEIIEELSDDLDIDEDDVEDLVDWDYEDSNDDDDNDDIDDIDSIDATVDEDDNRTNVRVEWEDGSVSHYTYSTDDEDEVIEELSDDLDIDEDDIEDMIDFDYLD